LAQEVIAMGHAVNGHGNMVEGRSPFTPLPIITQMGDGGAATVLRISGEQAQAEMDAALKVIERSGGGLVWAEVYHSGQPAVIMIFDVITSGVLRVGVVSAPPKP
jgi:hypothetical protein